jgi:tripartite-type tricarboxylate transporter receptor subunit TctC
MSKSLRVLTLTAGMLMVCWFMPHAQAETGYPERTITLVNPFAAGSPVDFIGRMIAEQLQGAWGKPVVIENRTGAGGTTGAASVAKAVPDGYTLLISTPSAVTSAPALMKSLPYDPAHDLVPIWAQISAGLVAVVSASSKVMSLDDLVRAARANPGKMTYGSAGIGSPQHLGGEAFMLRSGTRLVHVPYRGAAPALGDLVAGHVDVMFDAAGNVMSQIRAGQLRGLAILRARRTEVLPDVPTVAETGYPGMAVPGAVGLFAPKGTPPDILEQLETTVTKLMSDPKIQARLIETGNGSEYVGSRELARRLVDERKFFSDLVREAGIEPQ